jgi:hypothetical protein
MARKQKGKTKRPRWPTLKKELAEARATLGSDLGKLIRDNQDFKKLRPQEATDRIGLPPWFRVFWRKNHPEGAYSANDPTGGYPRASKKIIDWMLAHKNFRSRAAGAPAAKARAMRKAAIREIIDSNIRISVPQSGRHSESDIRLNFNDTNQVIAASNSIGGAQAQFASTDGGSTWQQGALPFTGTDVLHSDPAVDWTSDGTAWAVTMGMARDGSGNLTILTLRCYKSVDAGKTWTFDSKLSGTQTNVDKDMMWVDHSPRSPFKDNMYVIWHNDIPAFVARRTGIGGPWSAPIQVSGGETTGAAIGGDIKTNSFGDVFAFWPSAGNSKLFMAKSANGGNSFGKPVNIGQTFGAYEIGIPADNNRQVLIYISGGAYRTATRNLVYAAWTDLSGETGCTSGSGPGSDVTSHCKSRIWFSRSTDGGSNWGPARMINNQSTLNDQFFPHIAVDEANGQLLIVYYDTVGDSQRLKTDVWVQRSSDDGVTWSPAEKVTTAQTDETTQGANNNQYGDYIGLTGNRGIFFPAWTDRRGGGREEIWTAPIRLPANLPWLSLLLS